jgi:cytochrome c oxidase subunit 2
VARTTNPDDRSLNRGLGAWIAFTATGLIVLAGASFLVDRALAGKALASEPTVRVTGQQWWWRIEYRDPATGQRVETANELHLPLNTPTRVQILSADVIHSFWVPNLSGKIDMVTGRSNEAAQLAGGDPSRGRIAIQAQGCGACHEIPGIDRADGTVGPSLKKIAIQSFLAGDQPNDPAHMTAWVQHPQGVRPGVGMPDPPASDATVRDMVAYLYTLRK